MDRGQLQSGFVIPAIISEFKELGIQEVTIDALLAKLCAFETEANFQIESNKVTDNLILVLHNLILRGLPTFLWYDLEKELAKRLGALKEVKHLGGLGHEFVGGEGLLEFCWRALHVIDPRVNRASAWADYQQSWEGLDSRCEEDFLYREVPHRTFDGKGDFLLQLIQPQRSLGTMVENRSIRQEMSVNFQDQRADFVLEFPYSEGATGKRGVCMEVDGPHHSLAAQLSLDKKRDEAVLGAGWHPTLRFPVHEFGEPPHQRRFSTVEHYLQHEGIRLLKENYEQPLYQHPTGALALQIALVPFAIARVQMTLAKAILAGALPLDAEHWDIAIVERDVPCAHLAVANIQKVHEELTNLEGADRRLPSIGLKVYNTVEFEGFILNQGFDVSPLSDAVHDRHTYDLCLDVSMLGRQGWRGVTHGLSAEYVVYIRSAHFPAEEPAFLCGQRINWRDLLEADGKAPILSSVASLTFFLRNIFRKEGFRPGQIPILQLALQNKTVIGLLPTGGGKSLTYQIAGLLQPGLVLVVDPIKSLMKDQVDSLGRAGINRTVFINSMLKGLEERNRAYDKLQTGKALFCFVSPERLQIQRFRSLLKGMSDDALFFSYAVIDETHCVSEWGHDFRTSYLLLGRSILKYCPAYAGEVALFGLTATASYDVLSDVQRELSGNGVTGLEIPEEQIVRNPSTNRNEIQFVVDPICLDEEEVDEARENGGGADGFGWAIKELLGKRKQERIKYWLENVDAKFEDFKVKPERIVTEELIQLVYESEPRPSVDEIKEKVWSFGTEWTSFFDGNGKRAALIFAPHRTWFFGVTDQYKTPPGAKGNYDYLCAHTEGLRLGTYMGVDDKVAPIIGDRINADNIKNQEAFLAGQLDVMVATKAFGMGIDKSNIGLTIHNCYPSSIESFVQEAGRAGRDRKFALAVILFNTNPPFQYNDEAPFVEPDFDIQEYFHFNSFKGIIKEKVVLLELLTEIHFPPITRGEALARQLSKACEELAPKQGVVSEEIIFRIKFSPAHDNIWLNDEDGQTYGFLSRGNGGINVYHSTVEANFAKGCLEQLKSILEQSDEPLLSMPVPNFQNWFHSKFAGLSEQGIEKYLEEASIGQQLRLTIPFDNDLSRVYTKVAMYSNNLGLGIAQAVVQSCFDENAEAFLKKVAGHLHWNGGWWEAQVEAAALAQGTSKAACLDKLTQYLSAARNKADTEKALYRLFLIGVVDDYTVDFRTKTFEVVVTKKTAEDYHSYLRGYLSKFYSELRTDQIIEQLDQRQGNTEIQRMLNFLIEFMYKEIAAKRAIAIKDMRECCRIGLEQGNVAMKEWIHLYFNSKYAREGYSLVLPADILGGYRALPSKRMEEEQAYNASLLDWSDKGKEAELDWFYDFVKITTDDRSGSEVDNLKHLRGACIRILGSRKDNYVCYLLKVFVNIMLAEKLEDRQVNWNEITKDFLQGWHYYQEREEKNEEHVRKAACCVIKTIVGRLEQGDLAEKTKNLYHTVSLSLEAQWAEQFANKLSDQLKPIMP